jgi:hypothetical protein
MRIFYYPLGGPFIELVAARFTRLAEQNGNLASRRIELNALTTYTLGCT